MYLNFTKQTLTADLRIARKGARARKPQLGNAAWHALSCASGAAVRTSNLMPQHV